MAETTRAGAVRSGFHSLAESLWPEGSEVQVCLGIPGASLWDDIVSIGDTSMEADFATLSTNRSREETIRQDVLISSWRAGGPEMEQVVTDRAYELLGLIENHLRKTDPTLDGVALWCFLTNVEFTSTTTPTEGRIAAVLAQFTARTRIKTS